MRNMSFAETTEQARAKKKTVTRRDGWWFLKPGDRVQQVVKSMGLKKGETVEKIHVIEIVKTGAEVIGNIYLYPDPAEEIAKEGFPGMEVQEFVDKLCKITKKDIFHVINRIEFKYV
jgi:hypothetical protein